MSPRPRLARRMRLRLAIVVAGAALPIALWAVLPLPSRGAQSPESRAASLKSRIDQTRVRLGRKRGTERVLTSDIAAWSQRIARVQAEITRLEQRQARIQADLDAKRAELARIQENLRSERARLARLRARLAQARVVLARRLVAIYKADNPDIVTVILNAHGFADLIEQGEFMRRVSDQDQRIITLVRTALVGGIVGARLYFLIQNYGDVKHDLVSNIFSGSGLVWYGGLLGGTVAIVIWARWRGFLELALLDIAGPGLALGYAVGRIGCQVSGDGDYGIHSGLPWAMAYPKGEVPTTTEVHPTPIYETLAMGLVAWFLWRLRARARPGALFALYLVFGGIERFLVEFIRRNKEVAAGLTAAQVESLGLLVVGAVWVALLVRSGGLALSAARS